MESERKMNLIRPQSGILIDFTNGYDSEYIGQNGFCIIGSEQIHLSAICFLCGSFGKEAMLYCSVCCEPYHSFCLDESEGVFTSNNSMRQFSWICPKCTKCNECNRNDRQKVSCHKCLKSYHLECFNPKWNSEDKSMGEIKNHRLVYMVNEIPKSTDQ